ncbi:MULTISPECIES: ATP-binding protein [unclassified Streptomyces]|uniref:ATP-binding protein n=1 Tax=unclassified Streptomyces TaxID=2593676 RepID=UPI001F3BF30F|nr:MULTISPECIES: ATP-binding protein [unclassified Streptomyces]
MTCTRTYVPGPCRLDREIRKGTIRISVWDSSTTRPLIQAPDPERVGRHGSEIVMAVFQEFRVRQEPGGKRITVTLVLDGLEGNRTGREVG